MLDFFFLSLFAVKNCVQLSNKIPQIKKKKCLLQATIKLLKPAFGDALTVLSCFISFGNRRQIVLPYISVVLANSRRGAINKEPVLLSVGVNNCSNPY